MKMSIKKQLNNTSNKFTKGKLFDQNLEIKNRSIRTAINIQ